MKIVRDKRKGGTSADLALPYLMEFNLPLDT